MTHRQALLLGRRVAGGEPAICPGHLVHVESHASQLLELDPFVMHTISVYHCECCATRIVVRRRQLDDPDSPDAMITELKFEVVNVYLWTADKMVADLAHSFSTPLFESGPPSCDDARRANPAG